MKKWRIILIILTLGLALFAAVILPKLADAPKNVRTQVQANLIALEVAKARWMVAHTNGDWPTMSEVLPYLTNGMTLFVHIRPVREEIYIINKVGTPVIGYDPRTESVSFVSSNDYLRILEWDYK